MLIIAEGDSYTNLSPDEFYDKVLEAYNLGVDNDACLISFAGQLYLSGGE